MKIPNIYNFLNSICPNAFSSKSIKIQKYPGQNCPDASNPKYIKNSRNKLSSHIQFKKISKTHKTNYVNFLRILFYAKMFQF